MRYSLLNLLCCPNTGEDLVALVFKEAESRIAPAYVNAAERVNALGSVLGPVPPASNPTDFHRVLAGLSSAARAEDLPRNCEVEIEEGLLVSVNTGRWYPIVDGIPELLPDNLRDWTRDLALLRRFEDRVPAEILARLRSGEAGGMLADGEHHKVAEITLIGKVENLDAFLAPGYMAPFYLGSYNHAKDLIRGFANAVTFLDLKEGKVLLDVGCGYAWTTEWLAKLGVTSIGVDINRTYMDVGRQRMKGGVQPHLMVADVENLPLKDASCNAILGFDAFHHVPNRAAAMKGFFDKLVDGGKVVFVEPGSDHKDAPQSIDVMEKYGTLEHGMDYKDVCEYVKGTRFHPPEELFLNLVSNRSARDIYSKEQLFDRSYIGWRLFTISKPIPGVAPQLAVVHKGLRAWAKRQPLIYWLYRKLRRWFR